MAYSYQSVVSNGTLTNLLLTINYIDRSEISVYFNGALSTAWSWVGTTEKQITFSPAVPNGTTVLVRRATALPSPKHVFSSGAQFKAQAIDENNTQLLHAAQEAQEFRNNPAFPPGSIVNLEDGSLAFVANGTEKMRLTAAGYLGIGRAPTFPVDVGNDSGQQVVRLNGAGSGSAAGAAVYLKTGGTTHAVGNHSAVTGGAYDADLTLWAGAGSTRIYTGGAERLRVDPNGNIGIGESNPSGWNSKCVIKGVSGQVQSSVVCSGSTGSDIAASTATSAYGLWAASMQAYGDGVVQLSLNGANTKDKRVLLQTGNVARWSFGSNYDSESGSNLGSNFFIARFADNGSYLGKTTINRYNGAFVFDTSCAPGTDNIYPTGGAANRWSTVYAGTGTINTSDAREKTTVRPLSTAEVQAAKALANEIGAYKFLKAVQEKGASAREHVGLTVQRAIAVLTSFGLSPFNYGFICYDEWEQQISDAARDGADGPVIICEAGNRYSFRMDELLAFVARGAAAALEEQEARISALENRLDALSTS